VTYLTLTDNNGDTYSFNPTFSISSESFSSSVSTKKYMYASGGKITGDKFFKSRTKTISGSIIEETPGDLETEQRSLSFACIKGGALRIIGDNVNRYINVSAPDIEKEYEQFGCAVNYTISFVVDFPYWSADVATESEHVVAGDDTLTVDASGSDFIILPVITIESDQSEDMTSFKLANYSDGGQSLIVNCPYFTTDNNMEIDSQNGTIKLNNNNAIAYLADNSSFPRLQPMSNTINYEGNACTITFVFRRVYL
jgi:phage-related protein